MTALDWSRVRRSGARLPHSSPPKPPTEKQLRYIAHLARQLGADPPRPTSRADASRLIGLLERSCRLRPAAR